jgi:hypothetical protein
MDCAAEKICNDCGIAKPVGGFGVYRRNKDGRNGYCRPCAVIRSRATQAKVKADPERLGARRRQNAERKKAKRGALLADPILGPAAKAAARAAARRAFAKLPALDRLIRARERGKTVGWSLTREWAYSQYERQGGRCYWTGTHLDMSRKCVLRKPSLDRLTPGGPYSPDNVVLACFAANRARSNATAADFSAFLAELADALPAHRNANRT